MEVHTHMRTGTRTRINLLLDADQIRRLRQILGAPSNSAAVRKAIEERLAVEDGLEAMRDLRKSGAFNKLPSRYGRTFDVAARKGTLGVAARKRTLRSAARSR
jgi:hypothetical protein